MCESQYRKCHAKMWKNNNHKKIIRQISALYTKNYNSLNKIPICTLSSVMMYQIDRDIAHTMYKDLHNEIHNRNFSRLFLQQVWLRHFRNVADSVMTKIISL